MVLGSWRLLLLCGLGGVAESLGGGVLRGWMDAGLGGS